MVSGATRSRPVLDKMLEYVREGDTVYIENLSRLARSTKDLLNLMDAFTRKQVNLVSLEVIQKWEDGEITAVQAMRLTGLNRGTFYRRYNETRTTQDPPNPIQ